MSRTDCALGNTVFNVVIIVIISISITATLLPMWLWRKQPRKLTSLIV